MEKLFFDALDFEYGGWKEESQFASEMGQCYLEAAGIPGEPVDDATLTYTLNEDGRYRVYVRTKNWYLPDSPGKFEILNDGVSLGNVLGALPKNGWGFETAGEFVAEKGEHVLSVRDLTGWYARFACVIVTNDLDFTPSPEIEKIYALRHELKGTKPETFDMGHFDFIVCGAGPAGVPAALSAARHGLKTALINARPFVGGNAAEEGTIGLDGATGGGHHGYMETGIAAEIRALRFSRGLSWQKAMEELISREKNITVFSDMTVIGAETKNGIIKSVTAFNYKKYETYIFSGDLFADCTGDGWLGYYAGAAYRIGRESSAEFGESFAPEKPDTLTMSGCLTGSVNGAQRLCYYAEKTGSPVKFETPAFAPHFKPGADLGPDRSITGYTGGAWWIENRNAYDDLWEPEFIRDELIRLTAGYFGWLKNDFTGNENISREELADLKLMKIMPFNAKRESRRIVGDCIFTENDIGKLDFPDAVTYCGWRIDVHHPDGLYSGDGGAFHLNKWCEITALPYRALYSKNINNMFTAGRCISVSHVALGTARVEATCATMGQAVGVAAAFCKKYGVLPREAGEKHITEIKQTLLKDGQTIFGVLNEDKNDKARTATVSGEYEQNPLCLIAPLSNRPENVINGNLRPEADGENNTWISPEGLPQTLTLKLTKKAKINEVRVTLETDMTVPQYSYYHDFEWITPAKAFTVTLYNADKKTAESKVTDNIDRLVILPFDKVPADRVEITVTEAASNRAAVCEVRIY